MTQTTLDQAVEALAGKLGDNLYSCCLYGSAVRGNLLEGVSDLNLLIVLNLSDSAAHQRVAEAIGDLKEVDPFVLGRKGFERSARSFAAKFTSIKRNYRVLRGADPLAQVEISEILERFLCEQALRNLRLRMAYSFITRSRDKNYTRFLIKSVTPTFLRFSEVLRLDGIDVPVPFDQRIPLFERHFKFDASALRDLLAIKLSRETIAEQESEHWHERLFPLIDAVVHWIEDHWKDSDPV